MFDGILILEHKNTIKSILTRLSINNPKNPSISCPVIHGYFI
jgi:hypothetical protein